MGDKNKKIEYIIVSSNDDPLYLNFWPVFKKMSNHILNAKPVLVHVSDCNEYREDADSIVIKIKQVTKNTGFQAQISRLWAPIFFKDKVCMISDIDMLPLSTDYFNKFEINYNEFHILSANAYNDEMNYYPMCYNIAYGDTFKNLLQLPNDFNDFYENVLLVCEEENWTGDERFLSTRINNNKIHHINIVKHKRKFSRISCIADNRIDRVNLDKIDHYRYNKDLYIDFHCPRPYEQNKQFIDEICNIYTGM